MITYIYIYSYVSLPEGIHQKHSKTSAKKNPLQKSQRCQRSSSHGIFRVMDLASTIISCFLGRLKNRHREFFLMENPPFFVGTNNWNIIGKWWFSMGFNGIYLLVSSNMASWKIPELNGGFYRKITDFYGRLSIAMVDYRRVHSCTVYSEMMMWSFS